MHADSLFLLFTERLAAARIEHMVTGSIAATLYGEPRLTHDVDIVIHIAGADEAQRIVDAFPIEVIRAEQARGVRGHFNIIHHDTGFKADVYLMGRDPLHRWAFGARRRVTVEGTEIAVAPPEYVIVRKLEYYREGGSTKHLDDIRGMLRISGSQIDLARIEELVAERDLESAWALIRQ
jgi:hypothetical protein